MNLRGIFAIYHFEMSRMFRTVSQSIASPVLSTALYFIVFGSAIGSKIGNIDGVNYTSFLVPGLIMLTILNQVFQMHHSEFTFQNLVGPFMKYYLLQFHQLR